MHTPLAYAQSYHLDTALDHSVFWHFLGLFSIHEHGIGVRPSKWPGVSDNCLCSSWKCLQRVWWLRHAWTCWWSLTRLKLVSKAITAWWYWLHAHAWWWPHHRSGESMCPACFYPFFIKKLFQNPLIWFSPHFNSPCSFSQVKSIFDLRKWTIQKCFLHENDLQR